MSSYLQHNLISQFAIPEVFLTSEDAILGFTFITEMLDVRAVPVRRLWRYTGNGVDIFARWRAWVMIPSGQGGLKRSSQFGDMVANRS